jgi:hypothetical protein
MANGCLRLRSESRRVSSPVGFSYSIPCKSAGFGYAAEFVHPTRTASSSATSTTGTQTTTARRRFSSSQKRFSSSRRLTAISTSCARPGRQTGFRLSSSRGWRTCGASTSPTTAHPGSQRPHSCCRAGSCRAGHLGDGLSTCDARPARRTFEDERRRARWLHTRPERPRPSIACRSYERESDAVPLFGRRNVPAAPPTFG